MLRVTAALAEAPISRTKAGARHVLSVPVVHELARDSRLLEIAASFSQSLVAKNAGCSSGAFGNVLSKRGRNRTRCYVGLNALAVTNLKNFKSRGPSNRRCTRRPRRCR
jgi:hypothetical protein